MAVNEEVLGRLRRSATQDGLASSSQAELYEYMAALCQMQSFAAFGQSQYVQVCEAVRINLLRVYVESMQQHIAELNKQNTRVQWWFVVLAVASLLSSIVQVIVSLVGL